jgi:hypothetical protein
MTGWLKAGAPPPQEVHWAIAGTAQTATAAATQNDTNFFIGYLRIGLTSPSQNSICTRGRFAGDRNTVDLRGQRIRKGRRG